MFFKVFSRLEFARKRLENLDMTDEILEMFKREKKNGSYEKQENTTKTIQSTSNDAKYKSYQH